MTIGKLLLAPIIAAAWIIGLLWGVIRAFMSIAAGLLILGSILLAIFCPIGGLIGFILGALLLAFSTFPNTRR